MGVVYEAWDPELERRVAVKVLHPEVSSDEKARARMLREARSLARLSDPNVIQVYDVGTTREQVFVAMELVEGRTLSEWMAAGPHPWPAVLERVLAAGRGLQAAHAVGLVHRDFKPDNVLLGDDGRVRVLDFGLARAAPELDPAATGSRPVSLADAALEDASPSLKAALTQTGALMGTPLYMAPEQFEGRSADALSDQYSYCVALYQGLYGRRPYEADSIGMLVRNVVAGRVLPPPRGTAVPAAIERVLRRGMSVEPGARHPSMAALLAELERASADGRAPARRDRRSAFWLGVGAVAIGGALWLALQGPDGGDVEPDPAAAANADPPAATVATPSPPSVAGSVAPTGVAVVPTADPAPVDEPAAPRKIRDWCSIHEDSYKLVHRGNRRADHVRGDDGVCYRCRRETRRERIDRFRYKCGGYQVCSPAEPRDCE
jgi:hypothetical protein